MTRSPPYSCAARQNREKNLMLFCPRMNTEGFRSVNMLPNTYFTVVPLNGRKLHPSLLLWLRSTGWSMSVEKELPDYGIKFEKSEDQTCVGWVATIPAQCKNPAREHARADFVKNHQEFVWKDLFPTLIKLNNTHKPSQNPSNSVFICGQQEAAVNCILHLVPLGSQSCQK